jgi:flavin-dependent dehydrogenase
MPTINHFDIIIVGAGPAGLSTALHLARIAPELVSRTLILEKAHHPRPKLCGGGLLPDAEVVLETLGLDVTEIPHTDVDWAHFDYNGKGLRLRGEKGKPFAFRVIRRHEFDAWLAGKAKSRGMEIREGVTVKGIQQAADCIIVETDAGAFTAQVVVGADGANSLVRRAIVPPEALHVARLLEIVTGPIPEKSPHRQGDAYFDFVVVPQGIQGYVWDFPAVENGSPVRVRGIYDSNVHPYQADVPLRFALDEEFGRHGLHLSDYKLAGHPLRWFDAKSVFSASHILLVGDAAGVDAIFGEGISLSLGYGALAAQAILQAFQRQDFSFRSYKRSLLRSELGLALRRRTWWAKFIYALRLPLFQAILWRVLKWIVEWIARASLIGWARRQKKRAP